MSPLEINILLECYVSAEPGVNIKSEIWNSNAAREAISRLKFEGLIDGQSKATDKGETLVNRLLETPFPIIKYVFPDEPHTKHREE